MTKMKRRDFIVTGAAAGIAFPMILKQSTVKPLVIASANGNRFKNGGNVTAVQKAFQMMTGGSDVLDAVDRRREHRRARSTRRQCRLWRIAEC